MSHVRTSASTANNFTNNFTDSVAELWPQIKHFVYQRHQQVPGVRFVAMSSYVTGHRSFRLCENSWQQPRYLSEWNRNIAIAINDRSTPRWRRRVGVLAQNHCWLCCNAGATAFRARTALARIVVMSCYNLLSAPSCLSFRRFVSKSPNTSSRHRPRHSS